MNTLYIFDKKDNLSKYSLLVRESALVPNYQVRLMDIDSVEAFQPKIAFRCSAEQCALTDVNGFFVVRLRIPVSFFDLKEMLNSLGYRSWASEIEWKT